MKGTLCRCWIGHRATPGPPTLGTGWPSTWVELTHWRPAPTATAEALYLMEDCTGVGQLLAVLIADGPGGAQHLI